MKINKKTLGMNIKNIRVNKLKINMEEFANLIQSGKSNVSRWERGENAPNDLTLTKIAELGNTTVDELLYGSLEDVVNTMLREVVALYEDRSKTPDSETMEKIVNMYERVIYNSSNTLYNELLNSNEVRSSFSDKEYLNSYKTESAAAEKKYFSIISQKVISKCKQNDIKPSDIKGIEDIFTNVLAGLTKNKQYNEKSFIEYASNEVLKLSGITLPRFIENAELEGQEISGETYKKVATILNNCFKELYDLTKE